MKITARPSAASAALKDSCMSCWLPADVEAVARRQLHRLDDLLHVACRRRPTAGLRRSRRCAMRRCRSWRLMICGLSVSTNSATWRSGTMRGLPSGRARCSRRTGRRGRRRCCAAVLRQLHVDLVVLAVGAEPVADRVAGDQRAQRRADLLHREPEVARELVVEPHGDRRVRAPSRCSPGRRCPGSSRPSPASSLRSARRARPCRDRAG